MATRTCALRTVVSLLALLAFTSASPQNGIQVDRRATTPSCSDGGQLHCCDVTFNGANALIVGASDLACYDLTPGTTNCIIASDSSDGNCAGNYACCQVNDLIPVIGLFCSDPPGGCVGEEGDGACTDLLNNKNGFRFGQCDEDDVRRIRGVLGLSIFDIDIKS